MTPFRPSLEADLDALVALEGDYYAEDGYPFDAARSRRTFADLAASPELGGLWSAIDDGRVVGYLAVTFGYSLEYGGRDAFLDELYLAPEARGRGWGRLAMELAERFCRERGVRALHLEVEAHRGAARELYRSRGFEPTGRGLLTKRL